MLRTLRKVFTAGLLLVASFSHAQKTINVPADQKTIQAAINAANTGDTVLVAPGTYRENLTISGKEISLTSSAGAATTILDTAASGSVITLTNTPTLKTLISGFTFRNSSSFGPYTIAGVQMMSAGATITNNVFAASSNAYAVYGQTSSVTFSSNQVTASVPTSCYGNGVYLAAISSVLDATGAGAGDTITSNQIIGPGLTACSGYGIEVDESSTLTIQNNRISGFSTGMYLLGFANHAPIVIGQNLVTGNFRGGLYLSTGLYFPGADPADTFIVGNTFSNNLAGAAGMSGSAGPAEIAIATDVYRVALLNNIFATNSATNPVLDCSTSFTGQTPLIQDHNLFWNPAGAIAADACTSAVGTFGNISAAPDFSDADLHLLLISPAIDAGNNSAYFLLPQDFDGNPRLQDATILGYPTVDMGAYEYTAVKDGPASFLTLTSSNYDITSPSLNTVTLTALLTDSSGLPLASQPVSFNDASLPSAIAMTDATGKASVSYNLPFGLNAVTATYAGTSHAPAVSPVIYIYAGGVSLPSTTLTIKSSQNPSFTGSSVMFTVTSTSTDGTHPSPVSLTDNGVTLATLTTTSGTAMYSTSALTLGAHTLTASFAGDGAHASATASLTQQVQTIPTTTSFTCNPLTIYTQTTSLYTISVTSGGGTPTGTVTVTDDISNLISNAPLVNGAYQNGYIGETPGVRTLTATYTPTGAFVTSSATCSVTVQARPTTTMLTSSVNPSGTGQAVTFTASIAYGSPSTYVGVSGPVTFSDNGTPFATVTPTATGNTTFTASTTISTLGLGAHNITATLAPAQIYSPSSASITQTVGGATTVTTVMASPITAVSGTQVALTATVSNSVTPTSTPIGTVTFYENGTSVGTAPLVNGSASLPVSTLAAGPDQITATYNGETNFQASSSTSIIVTITAAPAVLTVTASANPATALLPVTFTIHLTASGSPVAGNTVFVRLDAIPPNSNSSLVPFTTDASGTAIYIASLPAGAYQITGTSTATAGLQQATGSVTETIAAIPTTTTLIAAPNPAAQGQSITFVANVAASAGNTSPTGTIKLFDGASLLATLPLLAGNNGAPSSATLALSTLAAGTHSLTASYTPTLNSFLASQSTALAVTITTQDFSFTASAPFLTIQTQHKGSLPLSLASLGGFNGPVMLSCGPNLPPFLTCELPASPIALGPNATVAVGLTLDTDELLNFYGALQPAPQVKAAPSLSRIALATLFPLALAGLIRRRRRFRSLLALALLAALAGTLTACGDKYPNHTPPGVYTVALTATGTAAGTSTPITHALKLTLNVTP